MKRVLPKGGLLICTHDTFIDPKVVFAGVDGWGAKGWYYRDDIGEDTFFIPPDIYFSMKYRTGFEEYGVYHRLTSTGFVLVN